MEVRGGPAHKHQCAEGEESQSFLFHKANLHDLYEVLSQCCQDMLALTQTSSEVALQHFIHTQIRACVTAVSVEVFKAAVQ